MKKALRTIWLALVLAFIYIPILVLAVYSFTDASMVGTGISAFSFENYINLFKKDELRSMILGTVLLALICACISTVLATLGAIGTFYSKKLPKTLINTANQIPIVNADIVTGFSICILLIVIMRVSKDTFIPLGIGHIVITAPFVYLSILPKLKQMDNGLYEAALDLGATPAQALFKVVIPQLIPGILSGFMLAVTLSLDDYFVTTYTKPSTFDTISTYVVNATKGSQTETKTALWALSTLIFLIVVTIVIVMNVLSGKKKGVKNEKD
ncbi:MAG: ABC transporter permease [Clostridia bacterium]|nr:ABC transporter permease [Clostridia bacterium]